MVSIFMHVRMLLVRVVLKYRDSSVFVLTDDVQANKLPLPIDDLQNGITHGILFSCRNLINVIEIATNQKTCLSSAPR